VRNSTLADSLICSTHFFVQCTVASHPSQKPITLLERIILASSNVGDAVLDLFSGTGR
jgi:DNA modification methylase